MGLLQKRIATWLLLIHLLVETNATYYGKLISRDWGSNSAITGDVYAIDNNTIQVINFSYNSNAGCSGFYLVQSSNSGGTNLAALPVSGEPTGPLRSFTGEDVVLEDLPDGSVLTDYTHLVLYHPLTQYECGRVPIPVLFVAPAPQAIGQFSSRAHAVRSGEVTVLNDRQIEIKAFRYDGQGPDAFFYVGVTDRVQLQAAPYGQIPDENGDSDRPGAYSDKDIILTLPASMSVTELKWLSMYCISYAHNFGEVFFPADLNVPPYKEPVVNPADYSCEVLSDELQISWRVSGDEIIMELAGNIDRSTDYMSFGLSGSTNSFSMIGSDVVVVDWVEGRQPNAVDYHINQYAQCNGRGSGVCTDTSNDVRVVSSRITDGITRVKYSRKLFTSDTTDDKDYKVDGTAQQIVWSIGPLNSKGEAAKHYPNKRTSESKTINFGRSPVDNCPGFITTTESPKPAFKPHHIYGRPGKSAFTAEIGPSAANQGYTALTGRPSWGIAWYIDGTLIPELHLKRGVSYKFNVYGGHDRTDTAKYHPFYITDSPVGGYSQSRNGTIYPAVISRRGRIQRRQRAVGTYCEWKLTQQAITESADGKTYQCFEEMKSDLVKECDADPLRKTTFVWTPNASTPDLVYYQCWTHANLGWKIHVYDELPSTDIQPDTCEPAANRK